MASAYKDITESYSPVPAMLPYAKMEISKHPKIFIGNLKYWIKDAFPRSNVAELNQVFNQLVSEGYVFFLCEVYPPSLTNENEIDLMKFVYKNDLTDIDHLILHQITNHDYNKLKSLSKSVAELGDMKMRMKLR